MNIKLDINNFDELDNVLRVSREVFKPTPEEKEKYHYREDWLNKIKNKGLIIAAKDKSSVIGFSICYPKGSILHIWNVGVVEKYIRIGVWKQMYKAIVKSAKQNGFNELTLNTYKNKFPNMYAFCLENGF